MVSVRGIRLGAKRSGRRTRVSRRAITPIRTNTGLKAALYQSGDGKGSTTIRPEAMQHTRKSPRKTVRVQALICLASSAASLREKVILSKEVDIGD
jgi:hypothetical protein